MLWVSKMIIDRVVHAVTGQSSIPGEIWWLLALEFGLACTGNVLARAIDYCDSLLAEQFTKHISVRIIEHASTLDLVSFEDPTFYDKLERARVQATDRLAMLTAVGRMGQQFVTLVSLSAGVFLFSPWILILLVACVVPAFLGESHFAFLGYSLSRRMTSQRRELDYLRVLGTSREGAKELKIFGLGNYITERYRKLADNIFKENRDLATRRVCLGSLLAVLGAQGTTALTL